MQMPDNMNICELTHSFAVQIANLKDDAYIQAIRKWAAENNFDEVDILDDRALKEVITLGVKEYQRMYGHLGKDMLLHMDNIKNLQR